MTKRMDGEPMRYGAGFSNAFMLKTKSVLRKMHGTPYDFAIAMERAVINLEVTKEEAAEAVSKYSIEYEESPDE